jgi:hypothetical protein
MVNNRGWLRIVEASIAILIIFSVLLIINNRNQFPQDDDLTRLITPMLEEIARNVTLREKIVNQGVAVEPELRIFVGNRIKQSTIKYDVVICNIDTICSLATFPQDAESMYASERVISSTLNTYGPRKVKIFLWRPTA